MLQQQSNALAELEEKRIPALEEELEIEEFDEEEKQRGKKEKEESVWESEESDQEVDDEKVKALIAQRR